MRQPEKLLERVRRNYRLISRRVQLVPEVHSDGPYRRGISEPKTHCVRKIIQVRSGRRLPMQCYVVYVAVHVAAVVKKSASQTVADIGKLHRKSQLLVKHEHRKPADRKTGARIPRAGLIQA